MRFLKKHDVWIIPVLIFIALFLLIWLKQFIDQRELPAEGWSRTIHTDLETNFKSPVLNHAGGAYHIFASDNKGIVKLALDDKTFKETAKKEMDFDKTAVRAVWGDGSRVIYKTSSDLKIFKNGQASVIDQNVSVTAADSGTVYYAKGSELKRWREGKTESLTKVKGTIKDIDIDKSGRVLVASDADGEGYMTLVTAAGTEPAVTPLFEFSISTQLSLSSAELLIDDNEAGIIYAMRSLRVPDQMITYHASAPLSEVKAGNSEWHPAPLSVFLKDDHTKIDQISEVNYVLNDGKAEILFAANGSIDTRTMAKNIYQAARDENGRWIATRISTSRNVSSQPFLIDSETIGYLDYTKQNDNYLLAFSSGHQRVIDRSLKLSSADFANSFSEAVLNLARGLPVLLILVALGVPALIIYGAITVFNIRAIEWNSPVAKWLILAAFFLSEILYLVQLNRPAFEYYAPAYLAFPGSAWVVPIAIGVVSYGIVHLVKKRKDWGIISESFYTMGLFLICAVLLYAPYIF